MGGEHLDAALERMRPGGRIPVCGMISAYNNEGARSEPVTALANMIYNRVTMKDFVAYEFFGIRDQFQADMRRWLAEGKIRYRQTILELIGAAVLNEHEGDTLVRHAAQSSVGKRLAIDSTD